MGYVGIAYAGIAVVGLLGGFVAYRTLSTRSVGALIGSLVVGLVGAFAGGLLGDNFFRIVVIGFFGLADVWTYAIVGAAILVTLYALVTSAIDAWRHRTRAAKPVSPGDADTGADAGADTDDDEFVVELTARPTRSARRR